ncbi:hypothetical protein K1T71_015040 [Dendrolimus kikuchii]|nr:hypothetical protein K1T71_015040 [Dendrolimus kikuchii]
MAKCGACGKFLSSSDCIRCSRCTAAFHRACVVIPETATVKSSWICPGCKCKVPREDNSSTPVKGITTTYVVPQVSSDNANTAGSSTIQGLEHDLAQEIRSFRHELSAMRAEIHECRVEISDFKSALHSYDEKITILECRVSSLETKFSESGPVGVDVLEDTIADLKLQLNEREQEFLYNDLEMTGIPEEKNESLMRIIKTISVKLGVEIEERDVVHVERVGSARRNRVEASDGIPGSNSANLMTSRPRSIAVRFARRVTRDQLLRASRVRRLLTTTDVEVAGPPGRVYINERLTRSNRHLFYCARQAGMRMKWRYIWTKDGKILARKEESQPVFLVRCQRDLNKIFGGNVV